MTFVPFLITYTIMQVSVKTKNQKISLHTIQGIVVIYGLWADIIW